MKSILEQIESNSLIKNEGKLMQGSKKSYGALANPTLILTPLVDAFAILVIYLLVHSMDTTNLKDFKNEIQLPMAKNGLNIKDSFNVKLKGGELIYDGNVISHEELSEKLTEYFEGTQSEGKTPKMVILADKATPYTEVNELILQGSAFGIEEIKFAVLRGPSS